MKHLIQNPVMTKDHTGLVNIFASLDILKIDSVFDIIKNWDGEFHGSVYNSTLTLLSKNRLQMWNGKWMVIVNGNWEMVIVSTQFKCFWGHWFEWKFNSVQPIQK